MKILHMLNVADLAFMAAGLAAALLMIMVGARDDRRGGDREEPAAGKLRSRRGD